MKKTIKPSILPWLVCICGGLGLLLRLWLYAAVDQKGMLPKNHIAETLLWILTALVVAALLWLTRGLKEGSKYRFNFPASQMGALGTAWAAFGIIVVSVTEMAVAGGDDMTLIMAMAGILAALALTFLALCRWKGQQPNMLFHLAVSVYLMLRLIWLYRSWSADPQLQDYCFQLLAVVCLMLASYHRARFAANEGIRKSYVLFALGGVYFCLLSLKGWGNTAFFLGMSIWMLTDLCSLKSMPDKRERPAPQEEETT